MTVPSIKAKGPHVAGNAGAAGENVPSAGFPIDLNHGGLPIYVQGRITEGGKIAAKQRQ